MLSYRAQIQFYVTFDRSFYCLIYWLRKAPHHVVSILWMDIRLQIELDAPKPFFFCNSAPFYSPREKTSHFRQPVTYYSTVHPTKPFVLFATYSTALYVVIIA
jgi:hypothetical protein